MYQIWHQLLMSLAPPSKQSGSLTCTNRVKSRAGDPTRFRRKFEQFRILELNSGSGDSRYDIRYESSADSWQARLECTWVLNGPTNKCTHTQTHLLRHTDAYSTQEWAKSSQFWSDLENAWKCCIMLHCVELRCIGSLHDISIHLCNSLACVLVTACLCTILLHIICKLSRYVRQNGYAMM